MSKVKVKENGVWVDANNISSEGSSALVAYQKQATNITVPANSKYTYTDTPTISNYSILGIVGAKAGHIKIDVCGFEYIGGTAYIDLRNTTSSEVTCFITYDLICKHN